jgi:hypothetical protein
MNVFKWITTVTLIVCCSGCTRVEYESQPLESIKTKPKVDEKVGVLYKPLTKKESMHYLGRNWQSRGYQPIQIAIENYSPHPVQYSQKGLSLPVADYETITAQAHQYTKAKAIGISAPSFTCLTVGILGLLLAPATFGLTGILVPISVGGVGLHTASKMMQADQSLDQDYQKKFLHHGELAGNSVVEGIVFVPLQAFKERSQQKLTLKVLDTKTEKVVIVQARCFRG